MFTAQAVKHNHLDGGKDRKEAVVVSLEKAAESKNAVDLAKLGLKATELYSKSEKVIADESKWTAVQLKKLEALVKRAAGAAMNAASGIEIPEF